MVRPLRRAHLTIWTLASIALAAILAASVMARKPPLPANPNFHWEQMP